METAVVEFTNDKVSRCEISIIPELAIVKSFVAVAVAVVVVVVVVVAVVVVFVVVVVAVDVVVVVLFLVHVVLLSLLFWMVIVKSSSCHCMLRNCNSNWLALCWELKNKRQLLLLLLLMLLLLFYYLTPNKQSASHLVHNRNSNNSKNNQQVTDSWQPNGQTKIAFACNKNKNRLRSIIKTIIPKRALLLLLVL